jgi:hypothetical protein
MDVKRYFVLGNALVGKLADEVPGDGAAKLPAVFFCERDGMSIELICCDFRILLEEALAIGECAGYIVAHLELRGVRSNDKGAAEVRFVLLKDRAEIDEENFIRAKGVIGRILSVRQQRIGAGANDSLVPVG